MDGVGSIGENLTREDIQGEFPFITGRGNWPERWTEELILMKQRGCKDRAEFLSQYQLGTCVV